MDHCHLDSFNTNVSSIVANSSPVSFPLFPSNIISFIRLWGQERTYSKPIDGQSVLRVDQKCLTWCVFSQAVHRLFQFLPKALSMLTWNLTHSYCPNFIFFNYLPGIIFAICITGNIQSMTHSLHKIILSRTIRYLEIITP